MYRRFVPLFILNGIVAAAFLYLPLVAYVRVGEDLERFSLFLSLASLFGGTLNLAISRYVDRTRNYSIAVFGTLLNMVAYLGLLVFTGPLAGIFYVARTAFSGLFYVPFITYVYRSTKREETPPLLLLRELTLPLGRFFVYAPMALFSSLDLGILLSAIFFPLFALYFSSLIKSSPKK